jgi:hypothetical protein
VTAQAIHHPVKKDENVLILGEPGYENRYRGFREHI